VVAPNTSKQNNYWDPIVTGQHVTVLLQNSMPDEAYQDLLGNAVKCKLTVLLKEYNPAIRNSI
jgi:hypothetical protein